MLYLLVHILLVLDKSYFDTTFSSNKAKAFIKELFTSPLLIALLSTNYRSSHGNAQKLISHIKEDHFPYYSFRDVSGLFWLARGEIVFEFNCVGPITCLDYSNQKFHYTRETQGRTNKHFMSKNNYLNILCSYWISV